MLSLASIDSDTQDSSEDDMEVDSVIRDAGGVAIGETRRLRPPMANADYSTPDSNIRLIKTIGYDPHATKPLKEAQAPLPISDFYDSTNESNRVSGRIASDISNRVQHNRTGDVPVRPTQDTARPSFMTGLHDMRPANERGGRQQSTRRALTETQVNETGTWGANAFSTAVHSVSGVYDKLTKGLRIDRPDESIRIHTAHEHDRIRTIPSLREFDPNRGKAAAHMQPPQPDATVADQFGTRPHNDHVALKRTSVVLPVAGYGQISIEGQWTNFTSQHDRLEHELTEVKMAEMEFHKGHLVPCHAHPSHPTGSDALIRARLDVAEHERRFGRAHNEHRPVHPAGFDGRTRVELDAASHHQRLGHTQQISVGPLNRTGFDTIERTELDATLHHQRMGHTQPIPTGPLNRTGFDTITRTELDTATYHQRMGHTQPTAVGPLNRTGFDNVTRTELDATAYHQRMGHTHPTAVGPLNPTGFDNIERTQLDATAYHQRMGHTQPTAVGPLNPTGFDNTERTQLDATAYHQRMGHTQPTAVGPLNPTGFDNVERTHLDAAAYHQRMGHTQPTAVGPLNPTGFDNVERTHLDAAAYHRRMGHTQPTAVGPLNQVGFDNIERTELDAAAYHQRLGHTQPTAVGPLNHVGFDAIPRTELDAAAYHKRLGHTQPTAVGPLNQVGFDAISRTELDITVHNQRLGHTQAETGHPTDLGSTFDAIGIHMAEEDISSYSREIGQAGWNAPRSQSTTADEGRAARVSPLNINEVSRDMALAFSYEGASRSAVDADRRSTNRTELNSGVRACGAHSMTTAAAAQPPADADAGARAAKRALYEQNTGGPVTDLSWVAHQRTAAASEPSRTKAPDAMSVRTLPSDPIGHTAVHSTTVSARDTAKKRELAPVHRKSTTEQPMFNKLPVIYESRRRMAMTPEVEPPVPASEYNYVERESTQLPDY